MVTQCPQCQTVFSSKTREEGCPECNWVGPHYMPRTVSDLDDIDEMQTREKYHHKTDSQQH
jgi:predicted  nucleic acid-binding Zn-ribbon protein